MDTTSIHELDFIQNLRSRAAGKNASIRLGIGDDAAVLRPPRGSELVVTTDFSLESRHFRRDWHSGASAGHRCLARGLSDLAAMGAKPIAAFLSLALPAGTLRNARSRRFISDFLDNLLKLAGQHSVILAGGDTAKAPGDEILADIVLIGSVPAGRALLRRGAKAGDGIYVTGHLGGAAAELEALANSPAKFAPATDDGTHPHLFPTPRITVGQTLLRRRLANACIDISDGLSTDLHHLCEESHVGAVVEAEALPLGGTLDQALHGGEDYELLFTSPKALPKKLAGVPITRIGTITPRRSGIRLRANGRLAPLKPQGWEHRF